MDGWYAVLLFIIAFISLTVLWGIGGISPLTLLRFVFGNADIMSRQDDRDFGDRVVAPPVDQQLSEAKQPIATTDNEVNNELSVNVIVPEAARDIIRFQAKVEALAALIKDGQVTNMAKGIERTFGCSRSSKEGSTYQQALRALQPLIKDQPRFPELTPEQVAARQALGLQD